jgi:hypothetical protein
VTYLKPVPPHARRWHCQLSREACDEGNKAMKDGGIIPRAGFSGSCTRFQWVTHEASVELQWSTHRARALGPVRHSRKILGNCRARRKILGVICRKFWDFCIIRWHRSRVHQSRPRERSHVTQPRASINVSCSREEPQSKGCEGQRRPAKASEGWVPDQGTKSRMKSLLFFAAASFAPSVQALLVSGSS